MFFGGLPLTFKVKLRHLAFITHSVPAERILPHLPKNLAKSLELETHRSPDGKRHALISATCFYNEGFRPTILPIPGINFEQSTYRTYVRFKGRPAAYFFGTWLSTRSSHVLEGAFARNAYAGQFKVQRRFDQKGYEEYSCRVSGPHGQTRFKLEALERETDRDLVDLITMRPHGLFPSKVPFALPSFFDQIVRHDKMSPLRGKLMDARFGPWEELGILTPEEGLKPASVLVQPEITFYFYPPVPLSLVRIAAPLQRRRNQPDLLIPSGLTRASLIESDKKSSSGT